MQSDRRLVALTRSGSSAAFAVIVERYREPLLAYARRLVGPTEAEDVLQQTLVNALGALRRDDRDVEVRPWLYRIAHNVSVNALRRSGRYHEQLDDQYDGVPQPPDLVDRKLTVHRLVDEINGLPERQRAAIVAHELEGRSYDEIARSMSATTPVVRQLVHRARTRLRDACGVVVPAWALRWLVMADVRTAGSERIGDAVAGGTAGAGLVKAGAALLATGAIATGAGGLVIERHHAPASKRHVEARVLPERASRPTFPAAAQPAREAPSYRPIKNASAEREAATHEVAQTPIHVRHGIEPKAPARPQRQARDGGGDSSDDPRPRGPGQGGSVEASHGGSGDHQGDGSSTSGGGTGSGSSSGDRPGDSSGNAGGTGSHDGSGSADSAATPPVEH